jgi:prepilin-type processing-associated H-X9-DG protein
MMMMIHSQDYVNVLYVDGMVVEMEIEEEKILV